MVSHYLSYLVYYDAVVYNWKQFITVTEVCNYVAMNSIYVIIYDVT